MFDKKILLTGAAGFIGFHLAKSLLKQGFKVVGLDNINDYYSTSLKYSRLTELGVKQEKAECWEVMSLSNKYSNFTFIRMGVENREQLPKLFRFEKFDLVIHLAAQAGVRYSIENPEVYIDSNIVGFLNILENCRHNQVEHLVYASSSSVYGENDKIPFSENDQTDAPISLYAATKKSNELMAYTYSYLYKIPTSGLRFFTVYGPWGRPDMAPMLFADAMTSQKEIKVFNNGEMSRDFTYIDDIVQGIIITLKNPYISEKIPYQLFNIGNGSPVSLLDFIICMEKSLSLVANKNYRPMQLGDVPRTWADTTRLNEMGYKSTTSVAEGVNIFVAWFKQYYNK